ncbi:hypothetical protein [Actinoplanes sp. NPDC026619]|uniref:hypothetical protein n=1 Tax=Actinoplanes sp. NPDC026619 TaxID=3155798 RepID=UPI0033FEFF63
MSSKPTPPPFNARALGELVLNRLAEIEYLNSKARQDEPGAVYERQHDRDRVTELSQHLGLYAQLADTAAHAEQNDVFAAEQQATRRRTDEDEF